MQNKNRILISVNEDTIEPAWFENVEPFINKVMNELNYSGQEVSILFCNDAYIQELNIKNLILNTVSMCQEKAEKAGVSIKVSSFEDFVLPTDKTKVQCALTNLIFNGVEASSVGCVILIDLFIETNQAKILVKNNGDKIADDLKDKIFEVDFTTKEKGNGLGLAICKQQMQMLGGDINLVHSNDIETLFELVLPL